MALSALIPIFLRLAPLADVATAKNSPLSAMIWRYIPGFGEMSDALPLSRRGNEIHVAVKIKFCHLDLIFSLWGAYRRFLSTAMQVVIVHNLSVLCVIEGKVSAEHDVIVVVRLHLDLLLLC